MMVLDASVWVSAITTGEAHHRETTAWLATVRASRSIASVPAHFPAEVIGAIRRLGTKPASVRRELDWIFNGPFFAISAVDPALALLAARVAGHTALRGSDAVYVALAALHQIPLVSWDREQRDRGRSFCRTMTPAEAMELP